MQHRYEIFVIHRDSKKVLYQGVVYAGFRYNGEVRNLGGGKFRRKNTSILGDI